MLYSSLGGLASLVILLLSVAQTATAGDFLSGLSAYNRGDYIRAFRDWYPLAEHGDPAAEAGLGFRSRRINHMIERSNLAELRSTKHVKLGARNGLIQSPPRAPAMLTRLKVHRHFGDPCRDIETGRAFDADRLQGNRAADQHVGADPDTDRRTCCHSAIRSGERSRCEIEGRCNHRPDHHATL